jgi:hypothetical protein
VKYFKKKKEDNMTTETEHEGETAYRCDDCGMHYKNQETAEKCEEYCREHGLCNSEITEKSMERGG